MVHFPATTIPILPRGNAVPKYFFHVYDGDQPVVQDSEGIELPNESEIERASSRMLKEVLGEPEFVETRGAGKSFHVVDESGRIIAIIPF
jgi:hypothetical protein